MKAIKIIIGIFLVMPILSCGKAKESELTVKMASENAFLIPNKAQSCTNRMAVDLDTGGETKVESDIGSSYFTYPGATISWVNTENSAFVVAM